LKSFCSAICRPTSVKEAAKKITVITGKAGKIIGTFRPAESAKPEVGNGGPVAGPDQAVHVINLREPNCRCRPALSSSTRMVEARACD
jgi:hypothetical protein